MTYLTLAECKKHLNIDSSFTDDDTYITSLATAAEEAVKMYIDYPLTQLEDSAGKLPQSLIHAMLLLIGNWYTFRESVSTLSTSAIPQAFEFLCSLHHDYKIDKSL